MNKGNKNSISFQVANDSGLFEWQGEYYRPILNSGLAEKLGHSKDHNKQAILHHANKPASKALTIGGSEYTLEELANALNIDLTNYNKGDRMNSKGVNIDLQQVELAYFKNHGISGNTLVKYGFTAFRTDTEIIVTNKSWNVYIKLDLEGNKNDTFKIKQGTKGKLISNFDFTFDQNSFTFDQNSFTFVKNNITFNSLDIIFIFEGITDLLKGLELGYNAYTSNCGVSSIANLLAKSNIENKVIFLCLDKDRAGQKAVDKVAIEATKKHNKIFNIELPFEAGSNKKDFCDYMSTNSNEDFLKLIDEAKEIKPTDIKITDTIYQSINNYYYKLVDKKEEIYEVKISNFVFELANNIIDEKGNYTRYVNLINTSGKKAIMEAIPEVLSSLDTLRKVCYQKGNYVIRNISNNDLQELFEYVIEQKTRNIRIYDKLGYIANKDIWVFQNKAYYKGKVYEAGKNNIIDIDNHGVTISNDFNFFAGVKHYISNNKLDIEAITRHFTGFIGDNDNYSGVLGLGFIVATIYSDIIFNKYRQFPFLFLKGKSKSGKTTYGNLLLSLVGYNAEGDNYSETTQNFLMKTLESLCNLPYWLDEYEESGKTKINANFLRGIYNRASSGKGTVKGTKSHSINGTLILSGEYTPARESVYNRCIFIDFPNADQRTEQNIKSFKELNKIKDYLSYFIEWLILNRNKDTEKLIIDTIEDRYKDYIELITESRLARMYSIISAGLALLPMSDNLTDNVYSWLDKYIKLEKAKTDTNDVINIFFEDVISLLNRNKIKNHIALHKVQGDNIEFLSMQFKEICDILELEKRGKYFIPYYQLKEYIEKSGLCFDKSKKVSIEGNKERRFCVYLDKLSEDLQIDIKNILLYETEQDGTSSN